MNLRILTISDIHYKSVYEKDTFVIKYFESFAAAINKIHEEKAINLVVLSGDISFSGEPRDYKTFLKKLRELLPPIPIYSIVGNHDVHWTFLKDALGPDNKLETLFATDIGEKLKDNNSPFIKVFQSFEDNFRADCNPSSITANSKLKEKFCDKKYCGYVWDEENKLLILLLNSAWYSFGPGVIKAYYDKLIKDVIKGLDGVLTELEKIISGDELSQQGKQTYAYKYFPYKQDVDDIIEHNPECKILTFSHHPPSWLKWEELFKSSENEDANFDKVRIASDILVTGHLHNPFQKANLLNGECYHLSNGAFLDYHFVDIKDVTNPITKFPNNWFTILDLNDTEFSYSGYNFKVKEKAGRKTTYEYLWDESVCEELPYILKDGAMPIESTELKSFYKKSNDNGWRNDNKIVTTNPRTLGNLIQLFKDSRLNEFKLPAGRSVKEEIKPNVFYDLLMENDQYLICINSLNFLHENLDKTASFTSLKKIDIFEKLYNSLNDGKSKVKLPVVAFYDFVELEAPISKRLEEFRIFENKQFVLYQSFKHLFFTKFKQWYNFKELSIVYDCIIVNGP